MPTTGEVYPTVAQVIAEAPWSDNTWLTPNNGLGVPNGTMVQITDATYDSGDQSFVWKGYTFDFSVIPSDALIDGVTVRIKSAREMAGNGTIGLVQLLSTTRAKVGDNKAAIDSDFPLTTSAQDFTFGANNDLWGNALTVAWVQDADFGVAIGFWARGANTDVEFDAVSIEIEYHVPSTPKVGTDASSAASDTATVTTSIGASELLGAGDTIGLDSPNDQTGSEVDDPNSSGAPAWSNPQDIDDASPLSEAIFGTFEQFAISEYLYSSDHGYALPADAVIDGVEVFTYENIVTDATFPPTLDYYLTKNGTSPVGSPKSSDLAPGDQVYGGAADLWGTTLTRAEVNATTFGVFAQAVHSDSQFEGSETRINHIRVKVYYHLVSSPFATESASKTEGDLPTSKAGTDTDGTHIEDASPIAALAAADSDGTKLEDVSLVAAESGADTQGSVTELGAMAAPITATDTQGAATESSALNAVESGADTWGGGTDAGLSAATVSALDLPGTPAEVGSPTAQEVGSDAGSMSDTAQTSSLFTGTDQQGTTDEMTSLQQAKEGTDANSTFAGSEVGDIVGTVAGADAGSGSDTATYRYILAAVDTNGVVTESAIALVTFAGSDASTGSDLSAVTAALIGLDQGVGSDAGQITGMIVFANGVDTSVGTDLATMLRFLVATDVQGSLAEVATMIGLPIGADVSQSLESGVLNLAAIASADVGASAEVALVVYFAVGVDLASGSEWAVISLSAADSSGIVTEIGNLAVSMLADDSSAVVEIANMLVGVAGFDEATATDIAIKIERGLLEAIETGRVVTTAAYGRVAGAGPHGSVAETGTGRVRNRS